MLLLFLMEVFVVPLLVLLFLMEVFVVPQLLVLLLLLPVRGVMAYTMPYSSALTTRLGLEYSINLQLIL